MPKLTRKQISANRQSAIDAGESGYWGNPCSRGHSGWRELKPNGIGRCRECDTIGNKSWRERNRDRVAANRLTWYEENREHALAYAKEWAEKNPERRKDNERAWREANKERRARLFREWVEKNRDRRLESVRAWRKKNRGRLTATQNKRYIAKMKRTMPGLDDEIEAVYVFAQRLRDAGEDVHVDHIVPLQGDLVSGLHVPWNLRVIDASENLSKGNRFEPYTETKQHKREE